ncbi:MAG TPA: hypothetical protein VG873_04320, partial [Burkholderiales bacterium]|nr:hypothetical protein [Burkholderiales bacterium]
MTRDERPLAAVPAWLWAALAIALGSQVLWQAARPSGPASDGAVPPAPSAAALRLAALGETAAVARLVPLHLQSFDVARYDAARVIGWLDAAL